MLAVNNVTVSWWNETKANAVSYVNMTIILGVISAGAHVASGYMQARAIDHAVDRMMQPINAIHQKVDIVINDVEAITKNAKTITGKIKAVDVKFQSTPPCGGRPINHWGC